MHCTGKLQTLVDQTTSKKDGIIQHTFRGWKDFQPHINLEEHCLCELKSVLWLEGFSATH